MTTNNSLSNIVSIENFDDVKETFNRKIKKKGKLRLGTYWSAYNRENLGTIPRKVENIIINERTDDTKKGFLSNTGRFSQRTQSVKYNFPGPGSYSNDTSTIDKSGISVYSSKGYGSGFISQTDRFDTYKEYRDMYNPGPSDYNIVKNDLGKKVDKSIKHNSLFKKSENISLKENFLTPGPGFYDTTQLVSANNTTNNFFFKSTSKRFGQFGEEKSDIKYSTLNTELNSRLNTMENFGKTTTFKSTFNNTGTSFTTNYSKNIVNTTNNFFPNITSYNSSQRVTTVGFKEYPKQLLTQMPLETSPDNNKNTDSSPLKTLTDTPIDTKMNKTFGMNLNNAVEASSIKKKIKPMQNTLSHFFQPLSPKNQNPLDTFGIKRFDTEIIDKANNTMSKWKQEKDSKNEIYQPHKEYLKFQREAFKQRTKTKPKKKKNTRKNDFYSTHSCFNMEKIIKHQSSIFLSKSPKEKIIDSKIPGPCYYSPKMSPSKTSFNTNKAKNWIAL